ncbi:MAG: ABC transporter substrate-binding protein [Ruminococcus sp.]|nr:ABC transporter substrate-binding protein [Ruminococcus sp.]
MKKAMKLLSIVLCIALICTAFAACGGKEDANTTDPNAATSDAGAANEIPVDKVFNVGISQFVQHPALDLATKGFRERLTELLGKDHVKFDEQNAANNTDTCSTIASSFVASKVDLILANATPALTAAMAATSTIPIVGTSITDYATALQIDLDKWEGHTGINITGSSDLAPLDQQADMLMSLVPDAKTVGIIYCSAEANSKYQVNVVTKCLEDKGITVKAYSFADANDVQAVTTKAVAECDAIYIPTDNAAAESTEIINNIAEPAKKPIIAGEEGICEGCGVATLSISYYDIGVAAANQAYDILVNGKDPAEMDITFADNFEKKYVKSRAEALGIKIPEDYKEIVANAE